MTMNVASSTQMMMELQAINSIEQLMKATRDASDQTVGMIHTY